MALYTHTHKDSSVWEDSCPNPHRMQFLENSLRTNLGFVPSPVAKKVLSGWYLLDKLLKVILPPPPHDSSERHPCKRERAERKVIKPYIYFYTFATKSPMPWNSCLATVSRVTLRAQHSCFKRLRSSLSLEWNSVTRNWRKQQLSSLAGSPWCQEKKWWWEEWVNIHLSSSKILNCRCGMHTTQAGHIEKPTTLGNQTCPLCKSNALFGYFLPVALFPNFCFQCQLLRLGESHLYCLLCMPFFLLDLREEPQHTRGRDSMRLLGLLSITIGPQIKIPPGPSFPTQTSRESTLHNLPSNMIPSRWPEIQKHYPPAPSLSLPLPPPQQTCSCCYSCNHLQLSTVPQLCGSRDFKCDKREAFPLPLNTAGQGSHKGSNSWDPTMCVSFRQISVRSP